MKKGYGPAYGAGANGARASDGIRSGARPGALRGNICILVTAAGAGAEAEARIFNGSWAALDGTGARAFNGSFAN